MAGRNIENYTLLRRGEFAYNKGNSLAYPQGCVFRLERDSALVPNVYVSFALPDTVDHGYFAHLFAAGFLNKQLAERINFGVRNNGLLNISPDEFLSCRVPLPPLSDQRKLSAIFSAAKAMYLASRSEVDALRRQRDALASELLTVHLRVREAERLSAAAG